TWPALFLRKENPMKFETLPSLSPESFDYLPRALRGAAFRRVLGTPDAVLSTPQERKIFSLPYANGDTVRASSPDLPRSVYPYWIFRLSGALSKTEGCAGTLVDESPFTLIRGLRLYQDSELIKDIDLAHLRVLSHFIYIVIYKI